MPNHEPIADGVYDLIRDENWSQTAASLAEMHPADIADVIDRSPREACETLFNLLADDVKPDVLSELEKTAGGEVLESLGNRELAKIVSRMSPDDAADVLAALPDERSEQVLGLMKDEESDDVRQLLEYDEDSAGGIMTTDLVVMREQQTVAEALEAIAYLDVEERFVYAYVVDAAGRLIGYIDIWQLLRERNRSRRLGELVQREFRAAQVDMDQEAVAHLAAQYDLDVVPVLDENGVLLGRITSDDIMDVMEEEASEDIFRLAGSDDAELESASVVKRCLVRLPWLLITLVGGFAMSVILKYFHARIADVIVLAAFVPVVLAMGGNTGIQSSTLVIRRIAVGGLQGRSLPFMLLREVLTGALMGLVCGAAIGLWAHSVIARGSATMALDPLHLAAVVGLALFASMTFAAVFGAFMPLVLNRIKVDPAVASGPFITMANDIAALLIYFGITVLLVRSLG